MSDPHDEPATLTDDEIHTQRFDSSVVATADDTTDTGDDSGDTTDATDTGDDSGDAGDATDTGGDDSGDSTDTSDTGDDA